MAVLLTGSTGKTSIRMARLLQDAKTPFLLASCKAESEAPSGMQATKFDWLDSSTFENPFQHKFPNGESISAIYLIAPEARDPVLPINAFIDHTFQKHKVRRFVLLAGASITKGVYHVGKVWQHMDDLGLEYSVLLATWFMENFFERQHRASIRDEGKIYTACGEGKIPFISATDIAAVAVRLLIDSKPPSTNYRVLGPELLTHDEIATKISSALGRDIVHVKLTEEQSFHWYLKLSMPEYVAKILTSVEVAAADRKSEMINDVVEKVAGRPP